MSSSQAVSRLDMILVGIQFSFAIVMYVAVLVLALVVLVAIIKIFKSK